MLNERKKKLINKALAIIGLILEDRLLIHLRGLTSAKQAWEDLRGLFVRVSVGSQIQLARKLFCTRLQAGESMLHHLEEMKGMLMDLREKNVVFIELQEASIILSSLDQTYDQFVSNLEVLPQAELTVLNVTSRLLEEEQKRKDNMQLRDTKPSNQYRHRHRHPSVSRDYGNML